MKIKVVRRFARGQYQEGTEPMVYDIYQRVGMFPLFKKWKICRHALEREDAIAYLEQYILDLSSEVIVDC